MYIFLHIFNVFCIVEHTLPQGFVYKEGRCFLVLKWAVGWLNLGTFDHFKRAYAHKLNLLAGIREVEPGSTPALPQHRSNPAFQLVLAIYKCKFERS